MMPGSAGLAYWPLCGADMNEQPLFRNRTSVVAMLVVAVLVTIGFLQGVDRPQSRDRPSSTFSTGRFGTKAFAELLEAQGFAVTRIRVPVAERPPDPGTTVVLIDARVDDADEAALESFVASGGRLLLAGSWFSGAADPVLGLIPSGSFGEHRSVFLDLPATARTDLPVPVGGFSTATELLPLMASGEGVLAGAKATGDGMVVMLADSRLLENDFLGRADNAAVAVGLVGDPSRPVSILEYPHGFTRAEGLAAIPVRWRWAFGLAALAGVVWMLGRARQLGPPDRQQRQLPPPRVEYVNSMASGLARTSDLSGALEPLRNRLEHEARVMSSGGTLDDSAALEAAVARLGLNPADAQRALRASSDPEDGMAVGRVLAALSQSRVRRGG